MSSQVSPGCDTRLVCFALVAREMSSGDEWAGARVLRDSGFGPRNLNPCMVRKCNQMPDRAIRGQEISISRFRKPLGTAALSLTTP